MLCRHLGSIPGLLDPSASGLSLGCTTSGDRGDCHACVKIHDLQRKAEDTLLNLENILAQVYEAKTARNNVHSMILYKMPNEITAAIFTMVLDDADSDPCLDEPPTRSEKLLCALTLAGVCTKWRDVAISAPRLWADVHVFLHSQNTSDDLNILKCMMERSKAVPLTLRLFLRDAGKFSLENLGESLSIVGKEYQRWFALRTRLPLEVIDFLFEKTGSLSGLSSLQMHWNDRLDGLTQRMQLPPFQAKELQPSRLSLTNITFMRLNISWKNVTHVVAHQFTNAQAVSLLRAAPMLQSCIFKCLTYSKYVEQGRIFVHRKLRYLSYHSEPDRYGLGSILAFFKFPSLERLDFTGLTVNDCTVLVDLFTRCNPPLKEVHLQDAIMGTGNYLITLLQAIPGVERLHLSPDPMYKIEWTDFFQNLAIDFPPTQESNGAAEESAPQGFLPCLQSLEVTYWRYFPWEYVPRILKKRGSSSAVQRPLKKFAIHKPGEIGANFGVPRNVFQELLSLRREGAHNECTVILGGIDWVQASSVAHGLLPAAHI
ncbi:hypothetical protein CPC08DRAFT_749895 [Agrocybe pediades]|nr:hypothetical protein CPC08DRAFT_749895 [Agrocybe pediades]